MSFNIPDPFLEKPSGSLRDDIEKIATKRANYTKSFLAQNKISPEEFSRKLASEPFNIEINHNDDKSLAVGIFELQKKFGFPEVDNATGCDGKFGPYTNMHYKEFLAKKGNQAKRTDLMDKADPTKTSENPSEKTAEFPEESDSSGTTPEEETQLNEVSISETIIIGDSLTVGMARAHGIDGTN